MDPVMHCTTLPRHLSFYQKRLASFDTEINTTSIDFLTPRYQCYQDNDCQGRLLASFQDDAKYEHVGQDIRSQGSKDLREKDLKISELKTKSKDNEKCSRSKIT
ncbi:hypothetical protein Tco_0715626 [Tanacetum coccineum]